MKSEKKIILVTVCHNRKQYLRKALDSALNSTLDKKHWVHLVIDSGSTQPEIRKIIKEYCDKHDHMNYKFFDDNINQMPAYNFALYYVEEKYPEIEFMMHLDSDDIISPKGLEVCLKNMQKHPQVGMLYSGFNGIDDKGKNLFKDHLKSKRPMSATEELTESGQRIYRVRQVGKNGNNFTHLRCLRLKEFRSKVGKFSEEYPFSTDFYIYTEVLDAGMILMRARNDDGTCPVLYHWRTQKKKNVPKGITCQVEKDHGETQRNDYLTMRDFYKGKWTKEGRM